MDAYNDEVEDDDDDDHDEQVEPVDFNQITMTVNDQEKSYARPGEGTNRVTLLDPHQVSPSTFYDNEYNQEYPHEEEDPN